MKQTAAGMEPKCLFLRSALDGTNLFLIPTLLFALNYFWWKIKFTDPKRKKGLLFSYSLAAAWPMARGKVGFRTEGQSSSGSSLELELGGVWSWKQLNRKPAVRCVLRWGGGVVLWFKFASFCSSQWLSPFFLFVPIAIIIHLLKDNNKTASCGQF